MNDSISNRASYTRCGALNYVNNFLMSSFYFPCIFYLSLMVMIENPFIDMSISNHKSSFQLQTGIFSIFKDDGGLEWDIVHLT